MHAQRSALLRQPRRLTPGPPLADYIHPDDPTNVYAKFTVEMNPLHGLYHNCNPGE